MITSLQHDTRSPRRGRFQRAEAAIARSARLIGAICVMAASLSVLASIGAVPAGASSPPAQFGGTDVATWFPGDSWTYDQTFNFNGSGSNVTINEVVTYTVSGTGSYDGYQVYNVNISGNITGGGGNVSGYSFNVSNGTVSGFEDLRISDLAMVFQKEEQSANGQVNTGFPLGWQNASAQMQYNMTPGPPWRKEVFRMHPGDTWHTHSLINVTGFLNYESVVSGGSNFNSNYTLDANASVSPQTVSVQAGTFATDYVDLTSTYDSTFDHRWWSPGVRNVVREHLQIPMSGGTASILRTLTSYSLPGHAASISELVNPDLSCAGGSVSVSGTLSYAGSPEPNQSLQATLDQSALGAGDVITKQVTTNADGTYHVVFNAPGQADGMSKGGVTGSWGIVVSGANTLRTATLEVLPGACADLSYSGPTSALSGSTATFSATLTSASGTPVQGAPIDFSLGSLTASATTSSSGVASASLDLNTSPGSYLLLVEFPGNSTYAPGVAEVPFVVESPTGLTYTGATSATYDEPATFSATLTSGTGIPIQGESVSFTLGDMQISATTNSQGVASKTVTVTAAAGSYQLLVAFAGASGYGAANTKVPFVVLRAPTTLQAAGAVSATWGEPSAPIYMTLRDADNTNRLASREVSFVLDNGSGRAVTTPVIAMTNASGVAQVSLTPTPAAGPGEYTLVASFTGSSDYLAASQDVPFHVAWQYHFVDANGTGTVKVNPPTKQFLFQAPSASPSEVSPSTTDPQMTVVALPDGEHVIDITYTSTELALVGAFVEETGQFVAVVDTVNHVYVLERTGVGLPGLPPFSPPSPPTLPSVPTMPTVPTMPSVPSMPSVPTMPTVPSSPPATLGGSNQWYRFVDATGQGTIELNPGTRQFVFAPTTGSPSRVLADPTMQAVSLAGGAEIVGVSYSSSSLGLAGVFVVEGSPLASSSGAGPFVAFADALSHLYVLGGI